MTVEVPRVPLFARPFYFLRHGETEANVLRIVAGSRDVPLTELGHVQAREAAALLAGRGITAICSSALQRARQTARYVAEALELPVTIVPELGERNWGALEGRPRDLCLAGVTPPGGETEEEFSSRVLRGFARVEPEGLPLIVSHSGVFRVLCRVLGVEPPGERIENARPVLCLPPDARSPIWRLELL
ncbi:MAG TPA: histidine phosphatase family protein [candidate division Zixibacteria bacterium]|nr:histidine phosphatase family protein [candidate division Zixibacteria bacterium]